MMVNMSIDQDEGSFYILSDNLFLNNTGGVKVTCLKFLIDSSCQMITQFIFILFRLEISTQSLHNHHYLTFVTREDFSVLPKNYSSFSFTLQFSL